MGRRLWILAIALLTLLTVADAILWRIAVRRLETCFDAWAAERKAAGWVVSRGSTTSGGFPLAATLTVNDVTVAMGEPDMPGGLTGHAAGIILRVALTEPRTLGIEAKGPQRFRLAGADELAVTASRLMAAVNLEAEADPRELDLLMENVKVALRTGGDPAGTLSIGKARCHFEFSREAGQGEPALKFSVESEALVLPSVVRWPLGTKVALATIEGAVVGPLPPVQALKPWAMAWRDGGGSLELQHLLLGWGPLSLSASATLALDDQLQPMGAGNSRLTGYEATLDALAASGALTKSAVIAAKAVLSLLAGTPAEGDTADVDVPLTLQYRTLSMRQVPLVRLPELDWPGQ